MVLTKKELIAYSNSLSAQNHDLRYRVQSLDSFVKILQAESRKRTDLIGKAIVYARENILSREESVQELIRMLQIAWEAEDEI